MIVNAERQFALGLPVPITGFNNGSTNLCYPYTLENIENAYYCFSIIDCEDLFENFRDDKKCEALTMLLVQSFHLNGDDFEDFVRSIDSENFKQLISDIKEVNGIEELQEEVQVSNNSNTLDFETCAHQISIHTSTPLSSVKNMTLKQFKRAIEEVGKSINWNYKIATVQLVENPNEYLTDKEHPLYCEPKIDKNRKMVTMKELMGLAGN